MAVSEFTIYFDGDVGTSIAVTLFVLCQLTYAQGSGTELKFPASGDNTCILIEVEMMNSLSLTMANGTTVSVPDWNFDNSSTISGSCSGNTRAISRQFAADNAIFTFTFFDDAQKEVSVTPSLNFIPDNIFKNSDMDSVLLETEAIDLSSDTESFECDSQIMKMASKSSAAGNKYDLTVRLNKFQAQAFNLEAGKFSTRSPLAIAEEGPLCYSCPSTDNPDQCRTTAKCAAGQVCSVQQVIQPHGLVTFWSGCEDVGTCSDLAESSQTPTIIGRRDTSYQRRCVYCCSTDLCNHNCTSFVNLALHRPAYQSSVDSWNGTPDLAVDGDTNKNFFHGSCMNTDKTGYPWWAVDLGHEFHVTKVKLYERDDAAADGRTFHLNVLVSSDNATTLDKSSPQFTQCGYYFGHSSDGDVITIDCPPGTSGRWVRIQDSDPGTEYFTLCEVEVFGF